MIPELFYMPVKRGLLKLTGRDRQSFLQGMVTNDVAHLTPGQGCYAFMLDATGHVLADMHILNAGEFLLLDVEEGMAPFVAQTLDKYLIMEKCRITDVTAEYGAVYIGGNGAAHYMETDYGLQGVGDWLVNQNAIISPHSADCFFYRLDMVNVPCFSLIFPDPRNMDVAYFPRKEDGDVVENVSHETWEGLRIEAGIPCFGVDIDSRVLAPETGQQKRAISYRKGCYIGQEIVARIDARGHTNRALAGFWLPDGELPAPETPVIADGREVGRITSAAHGPETGRAIALGYLRHEFAEPATVVTIAGQEAYVAALPFVG